MSDPDIIVPMLVKMREDAANLRDDMSARFDSMNRRFDAVDHRFESMEDRLEHLEHHAVVTNSKLDTLTKRVAHVEVVCEEGWAQVARTASSSD